jgi:glyoxylase-like metal-dependent hydrolase (beta-lactamase superfamily II)
MTLHRLLDRRAAIKEMGKTGLAIVVFGSAACSEPVVTATTTGTSGTPSSSTSSLAASPGTGQTTTTGALTSTSTPTGFAFQRVNLDFVSAYILYRGGEAALVDTGVDGSADAIEAALGEAGLGWDSVAHVILTHKHLDHIGSLGAVLERAGDAAVYAGAPDIPLIASIVVPQPVGDNDLVFDLEIIETPGHTAGHISVLDPAAGILVAGDALNGGGSGGVSAPSAEFSENMTVALDSVRKLAGFSYEVALFGHGEPLLEGASEAVATLAGG